MRLCIEVSLFGKHDFFNIFPDVFFRVKKFNIPWDTAGDCKEFKTFFRSKIRKEIFIIAVLYRFKPYLCCPPPIERALVAEGGLVHHVYQGTT